MDQPKQLSQAEMERTVLVEEKWSQREGVVLRHERFVYRDGTRSEWTTTETPFREVPHTTVVSWPIVFSCDQLRAMIETVKGPSSNAIVWIDPRTERDLKIAQSVMDAAVKITGVQQPETYVCNRCSTICQAGTYCRTCQAQGMREGLPNTAERLGGDPEGFGGTDL